MWAWSVKLVLEEVEATTCGQFCRHQAYAQQAADGFYSSRGVELQSMEMTRYDMVDQELTQSESRSVEGIGGCFKM